MTPPVVCGGCATPLAPTADWCWLCLAPRPPAAAPERVFRDDRRPTAPPPVVRRSRWRRSDITYGPAGRLAWTVGLLLPLVLFVDQIAVGGLVGVVAYGGVVLPWALRDVWRLVG